jgi:hypothetical protein
MKYCVHCGLDNLTNPEAKGDRQVFTNGIHFSVPLTREAKRELVLFANRHRPLAPTCDCHCHDHDRRAFWPNFWFEGRAEIHGDIFRDPSDLKCAQFDDAMAFLVEVFFKPKGILLTGVVEQLGEFPEAIFFRGDRIEVYEPAA